MAADDTAPRRPDGLVDSTGDWLMLTNALRGDESAAAELVRRHGGRLFACAHRVLGDAGAADEIVQDAFDQLFRRGAELRRASALST